MFLTDRDLGPRSKGTILKELPPIPYTGWTTPREFPRLDEATIISIDTETKEPAFDFGPGWGRGMGHMVGLAVAAQDRLGNTGKWYFPMRHEVCPEENLNPQHVLEWCKPYLENPHLPKVGANLIYDVGWLTEEGIAVAGDLHDVQFAEALLDNDAKVALQVLASRYLGLSKETDLMYDWIMRAYKPGKGKERGEIWRTPPSLVGFYGEQDAVLPLQILQKQWPEIQAQGLSEVYRMECDLIYLLVEMRRAGVTVDIHKAETLYEQLTKELEILYIKLSTEVGRTITGVNSAEELAPIFDKLGIKYRRTAPTKSKPRGSPSIDDEFLSSVEHPIAQGISAIRKMQKIRDTFIKSYILDSHVKGKVHGNFHPLRGEGGGTVTGRFSSSNPNLQNISKRSKLGMQVRYMFKHDEGHKGCGSGDFSQIEYRMLVHHGVGDGIEEVRRQYREDPSTDYHRLTQKLVQDVGGVTIPRNGEEAAKVGISLTIKEINFGLLYGMKENKLGRQAKLDSQTTKKVFAAYHSGAPYVQETMEAIQKEVYEHGYITTISGRRTRFNLWEKKETFYGEERKALPLTQALEQWGSGIQRAYAYRGVNYKLQGGAADVLKRAMWRCWKEGVYKTIGVPRLTVHDENFHSIIDYSPEQAEGYRHMIYLMENSTPLRIPVKLDWGIGQSWGEC